MDDDWESLLFVEEKFMADGFAAGKRACVNALSTDDYSSRPAL